MSVNALPWAAILAAFAVYVVPWTVGAAQLLMFAHEEIKHWHGRRKAKRAAKAIACRPPWISAAPEPLPPIDDRERDVPPRVPPGTFDFELPRRHVLHQSPPEPSPADLAADVEHVITLAVRACRDAADHTQP